jgi:hypothetical protein
MRVAPLALLFVVACGSAPGHRAAAPHRDATARTGPPVVSPPAGDPTAACAQLIDHLVAVQLAERRVPAAQQPTAAERAAITAELRADPACRELSAERLRCALAAATVGAIEACYRTPSSSTSNSSVAPGGMTPPAPRLP